MDPVMSNTKASEAPTWGVEESDTADNWRPDSDRNPCDVTDDVMRQARARVTRNIEEKDGGDG